MFDLTNLLQKCSNSITFNSRQREALTELLDLITYCCHFLDNSLILVQHLLKIYQLRSGDCRNFFRQLQSDMYELCNSIDVSFNQSARRNCGSTESDSRRVQCTLITGNGVLVAGDVDFFQYCFGFGTGEACASEIDQQKVNVSSTCSDLVTFSL